MACQNQMHICTIKQTMCNHVGCEELCPHHKTDCGCDNVPSFRQWKVIYADQAEKRHQQTDMLGRDVRRKILAALEEFKQVMGYTDDDKISVINRKSLAKFCELTGGRGITKKSKVEKIGQAFAKWIRFSTEDEWVVPRFDLPEIRDDSERFHDPSKDLLLAIAMWYRSLYGKGLGRFHNRDRLYAMFMYKYAMRNGDVDRLKWSDIKEIDGRLRLEYKPHKTRLSSGRIVKIVIDVLDAEDIKSFRETSGGQTDGFIFGGGTNSTLRDRLNSQLRELGVSGSKGMYILRKICVNAVFKKYGREAASAISGDDFRTIKVHYADPDAIRVNAPENSMLC